MKFNKPIILNLVHDMDSPQKNSVELECQICCLEYNKKNRKKVVCPKCTFECCIACVQTYLTTQAGEVHCMNCGVHMSLGRIHETFTPTFLKKTWRPIQEDLLYSKECTELPHYQELAYTSTELNKKRKKLKDEYQNLIPIHNKLYREYVAMKQQVDAKENEIYRTESELRGLFSKKNIQKKEKSTYHTSCSNGDCPGFLNDKWLCETCQYYTCKTCLEVIKDEKKSDHECNEDIKKTADIIRQECKRCPSCGVQIYKISGCNVMFCTSCHTGFHWNTLQICKSGEVHNPHYYEYLASNATNNRNPNDPPCFTNTDGLGLQPYFLRQELRAYKNRHISLSTKTKLETFNRILSHCYYYFGRQSLDHNNDEQVIRYRCEYLGKNITRDEFKRKMFLKERQRTYMQARRDLYGMFATCGTDILHRYFTNDNRSQQPTDVRNCMKEIIALVQYVNDAAEKIRSIYKIQMIFIVLKSHKDGFTAETFTNKKWTEQQNYNVTESIIIDDA